MRKIISIIAVLFMLVSCAGAETFTEDEINFEHEYELLNGQYDLEGTHQYKTIDIPSDNNVEIKTLDEINEIIASGTGVVYLGFPECPWCRTLMPALFDAVGQAGEGLPLYYCNAVTERDSMHLSDDGEIIVDNEGTEAYKKLVELLYDNIGEYKGLNDPSIKRVYLPTTVFVKDGKVMYANLVTVESQESGYDDLTDEQYNELVGLLVSGIEAIK